MCNNTPTKDNFQLPTSNGTSFPNPQFNGGFTLVELLIAISLFVLLASPAIVLLITPRRSAILTSTTNQLVATIREAQTKSITGNTEGESNTDNYGVYFNLTSYTLFKGTDYSEGDSHNFVTNLGTDVEFATINIPSSSLIFEKLSGEVRNFDPNHNTIVIKDTQTGDTKTFTVNRLGVVNVR